MTPLLLLLLTLTVPPDEARRCPADPSCTLTAAAVEGSVRVDGVLDEPDWQRAPVATGFRQFEPEEGAVPSQRSEVRILYGEAALYVGAMLYDDSPEAILRTLGRRDEFNQADWFHVSIDSYFDRKTAYTFAINAGGVQVDGIRTDRLDTSWDAVWESATRVTPEGWVVELRIPYSMLRFAEADVQRWGINFRRRIPRLGEVSDWALIRRSELGAGAVAQFGILDGLRGIRPRRNIQVTPYTLARLQSEENEDLPGERLVDTGIDVGGDVKIGLSSNVTLDATISPDFGQVESDPAVLNLSAFETFFPERRPFFTEGIQIFEYDLERGGRLLYTRRIGAEAPIIGAMKLSGRTSNGLSFGVLGAATGDNFDPSRFYSTARLRQQLGDYSQVGAILTGFDGPEARSLSTGADWDLRFGGNTYRFNGQTSFAHRNAFEPDEDDDTGFSLMAGLDKIRGVWNFFSGITVISDGFNPNDLGRLRRDDYLNANLGVSHQINDGEAFGPFRRASFTLFAGNGASYREQLDLGLGFFFFSDWELRGYQEIELNIRSDYLLGGYDINETRGLGPRAQPREMSVDLTYETDSRRHWRLESTIRGEFYDDGGRAVGAGVELDWNVSARLGLSLEAGFGRDLGRSAWASNAAFLPRDDGGWALGEESAAPDDEDQTFRPFDDGGLLAPLLAATTPYDDAGSYYLPVFGERDTRVADVTLRSDITFSPTLSVQFYGQLFAARGRYQNLALLLDRDTLAPLPSYPKSHDFALSSFQTNTVLRWEYRPGSTLFLVWSQARDGSPDLDPFDRDRPSPFARRTTDQFGDTFNLFPTDVFLVKLSYKFLR